MIKSSALILILISTQSVASTIEVTYLLKSQHFASGFTNKTYHGGDFNNDHQFIGLEYRRSNNALSASTFVNSFYKRSYMADYARYWHPYGNTEVSARIGFVTGYDSLSECISGERMKVCPSMSFGIAYTKLDYFIPKISMTPKALTFSLSARF